MTSTDDVRRLGAVDWFIFVGMLILSASTGVYHALAKGGQQNLSQYLIGDRSMSALPIAMSYFVTYTSATAITGYPADVYLFGMQLGVIYIGYILGTVVVMFLFIPFIRQFNFISIYEVSLVE
ncbi:sodium-coupled monocarboxylate transporter 1-like [Saccoglossus kowalevskii]